MSSSADSFTFSADLQANPGILCSSSSSSSLSDTSSSSNPSSPKSGPTCSRTGKKIGSNSTGSSRSNKKKGDAMSSGIVEMKVGDLSEPIQALCIEALAARKMAYAPYSKFFVGAALQLKSGAMITGCNVENASYGLAICAERTACVKAVSQGQQDFSAIAIAADIKGSYVGPCGACRQFMCEFNPELPIYLVRVDQNVQVTSLAKLLPESFSPKTMNFEFHNRTEEQNNGIN